MRSFMVSPVLLGAGLLLATAVADSQGGGGAQKPAAPPLLQDYISFTVTAPPAALELDPFYKKFVDALGIPVVTSAKVPDAALLMARDIVQFMLANRPDLRKELIRKKWKLAIMAQTEVTYDIPEHRKYRLLPKIDDERLTPEQRENYHKPGGVGTMTGEQYWNVRGRGFGGEPDGENTTSCAEENLLGYPGTRYFGSSICVHEFSHGIMRGAIYTVDPDTARRSRTPTPPRRSRACRRRRAIPATTSTSTWATGIEAYVFGSGRGPETLLEADPRLYELVRQVIPSTKMPGNVYVGRTRQAQPPK